MNSCRVCKIEYEIAPEDLIFYQKMDVPAPALCSTCRAKRRLAFRNERTLYRRGCALCSASIITMYHPKSPFTVYCNACWASDKWDSKSYAVDYDKNKPFFDQLKALVQKVPKAATYSTTVGGTPNINSDYTNFAGGNKDCYLIFNSGPRNENCSYGRGLMNAKDTFDSYFGDEIERVYEGINVHKSAGVAWAQNATECLDSWFLVNCGGCSSCFGCVNLRHKKYQFFNEQLTPEDWKSRVKEIVGSYAKTEEAKKQFAAHAVHFPHRENNNLKSVDCTGDYEFDSKNCKNSFEITACEDSKYLFSLKLAKDCYDCLGHGRGSELLLECVGVGYASRTLSSWWTENTRDVMYSFATRNAENCIGCSDIKGIKYTILNKQYTEEEYAELRAHIVAELKSIGEYGLFMPPSLAMFAYNETIGQDNLPMSREEAVAIGFRWEDDIPRTKGKETMTPEQIPDHINDAPATIVNETLRCITCGYNYRLTPAEFATYKRALIPIPRECFSCRHESRLLRRGPLTIYSRACAKCSKPIKTNFAPDRPEIVYCEACYQKEVI